MSEIKHRSNFKIDNAMIELTFLSNDKFIDLPAMQYLTCVTSFHIIRNDTMK